MAILTQQLSNGLALLAEPMPWLESAAFAILVPGGCSRDAEGLAGVSTMTCEMVQRGSGTRDSRQFIEDLELLGADFSSNVSNAHASFGGAMPAESLFDVLAIYADLIRKPHLPPKQLEDARLNCLQDVRALEDDLPQKMMQRLRWRYYGDPFGRSHAPTRSTRARTCLWWGVPANQSRSSEEVSSLGATPTASDEPPGPYPDRTPHGRSEVSRAAASGAGLASVSSGVGPLSVPSRTRSQRVGR